MNGQIEDRPDIKPDITPPSPCPSPPLREVSPNAKTQPIPPPVAPPVAPKPKAPAMTSTRFAARTADGDRQCTNCGEVDTPQWRGTLCNACALWKRSRGTDRPLPLLFPVRKRPRSPTPVEEEEPIIVHGHPEIPAWIQPGPAGSPIYAQYPMNAPFATRCLSCGQGAEMLVNSRPACGSCVRGLTRNHGASSPAHMATVHRTMQISRPPSSGRASPYVHGPPILIHGYGAPTPTSVSVLGTPATSNSGAKLPLAYHTPISPVIKGHLPPHMAAMLPSKATASSSSETRGRKRAATVSGNGSADERAHPTASVHLQQSPPEQRQYKVSPSPPPRLSSEKQKSPPSETEQLRRPSGARRSTVSGASPFLPPKEEFMEHAEWLYGVLSRTERLLQELGLQEDPQSRQEA